MNKSKIDPKVECPLKLGDEIGVGNIELESKDCYVYEVCMEHKLSTDGIQKVSLKCLKFILFF